MLAQSYNAAHEFFVNSRRKRICNI